MAWPAEAKSMTRKRITLLTVMVVAALLAACDHQTIYSHYEHTPVAGWDRDDPVLFHVSPFTDSLTCQQELALRVSGDYPYRDITLVVEQTRHPSGAEFRDTLSCELLSKEGNSRGSGVGIYHFTFPLRQLPVRRGDSLTVSVRHDMSRETLPGIFDIGLWIRRP